MPTDSLYSEPSFIGCISKNKESFLSHPDICVWRYSSYTVLVSHEDIATIVMIKHAVNDNLFFKKSIITLSDCYLEVSPCFLYCCSLNCRVGDFLGYCCVVDYYY